LHAFGESLGIVQSIDADNLLTFQRALAKRADLLLGVRRSRHCRKGLHIDADRKTACNDRVFEGRNTSVPVGFCILIALAVISEIGKIDRRLKTKQIV
jgi:hypothetical protein